MDTKEGATDLAKLLPTMGIEMVLALEEIVRRYAEQGVPVGLAQRLANESVRLIWEDMALVPIRKKL